METQLPSLQNPHKIEKTSADMKTRYKMIIWIVVASLGCGILGGNWFVWLVGLFVAKFVARVVLAFAFGCLLYVFMYALIFGGLFWVLIS